MRLIFYGSGEFGLPTLRGLAARHDLLAVVSQPDKPAGRKRQLSPTPIAAWAERERLRVLKSDDVNAPDFAAAIADLAPDAAVVIAFGQKLSPQLIAASGRLAVNLHSSLLPRFRGAAPINWAILTGAAETGVSVISLDQKMDAGLIYAQAATPIDPLETAGELHDRLASLGPALIDDVLTRFAAGTLTGKPQDPALATRAPKLSKDDGTVRFDQPADEVRRRIHGLTPWPGVWITWKRQADGSSQKLALRRVAADPETTNSAVPGVILAGCRVACSPGAVRLLEVQSEGGRIMPIAQFTRGKPIAPGDRFD